MATFRDNTHMLEALKATSLCMNGLGFVIMMEHPSKNRYDSSGKYFDYSIHPRMDQPCQGGDMRRYKGTHPGMCTQPHNDRPCDLYSPFPEGKPSAIAFHVFKEKELSDGLLEALFSESSPWKKGFGSLSNVVMTERDGKPYGFILKNLAVDPTVLVSLLSFINSVRNSNMFDGLVNSGLTKNEAMAVMMLNNFQTGSLQETQDYYFPTVFSARRFFEGRPNDLSGGLYSKGVDYNRTYIQDVFSGDTKRGGKMWYTEMTEIMTRMNLKTEHVFYDFGIHVDGVGHAVANPEVAENNLKVIALAAKEFFAKALADEPELTEEDTRYVYRDATGKVLPYPKAALRANPLLNILESEAPKKKVS